jgi:hypothetical protein
MLRRVSPLPRLGLIPIHTGLTPLPKPIPPLRGWCVGQDLIAETNRESWIAEESLIKSQPLSPLPRLEPQIPRSG